MDVQANKMNKNNMSNKTKSDSSASKTEYLVIRIPKPKNMERVGWIALTLILAFVAFYGPIVDTISNSADYVTASLFGADDTAGNVVVAEIEEVVVEAEPVVEEEEEVVEPEPEPEVIEEVEEEVLLNGNIALTVTKITSEKKTDSWGKVLSINYEVDNQKADFYPVIKVFAYDKNDETIDKTTEKGLYAFVNPSTAGDVKSGVISLTGANMDILDGVTVTVQLYDNADDELVDTVTSLITIS